MHLGRRVSISRTIVEAHGGTLRATNREVGGACFCVTLPPAAAAGEQAQAGPG